jgi:hypothetical protein
MLNEFHKAFVGEPIEEGLDIQTQQPVYFLRQQSRVQRIQRLMLTSPWSEPIREGYG